MGEVSSGGVSPVMVEVEAGATIGACEAIVEEVVTIAVCESVEERTVGVSRRHPSSAAMAIIRGRSLIETLKRFAST
jgi:hypothetical protein